MREERLVRFVPPVRAVRESVGTPMRVVITDGGRADAGFRGRAGDCAARAISIATGLPYIEVYRTINAVAAKERPKAGGRRSSAREGVYRSTVDKLMSSIGWTWVPTMKVGTGCRVHLRDGELPSGRLVVRLSRHFSAVIDGVIYDSHDPSRGGTRCVYGYWHGPVLRHDALRLREVVR